MSLPKTKEPKGKITLPLLIIKVDYPKKKSKNSLKKLKNSKMKMMLSERKLMLKTP